MGTTAWPVYTIGHSNHSAEEFLQLLRGHEINQVMDVRSSPRSRWVPHFNPDQLEELLENAGIDYALAGGELGGRPADRSAYDADGRVSYDRVAETDVFDDGIARVVRAADERCIALLCMERDPLDCHRALLVARALGERGVEVEHILGDGSLETHDATMTRLLESLKMPLNGDMFRTREDIVTDAIDRRSRKVAYVAEQPTEYGYRESR